jgi:hypothetical protein
VVKVDYTEPDLRMDLAHGSGNDLAAKRVADQLGGIDRVRAALELLEKLR